MYTDAAQPFEAEQDLITTSQPLPFVTDSFLDFEEISPHIHEKTEKPSEFSSQNTLDHSQILSTEKSVNINPLNHDNNILKSDNDPFLRSSDSSHPIFDPPFSDIDTAKRKKPSTKPPHFKSSCPCQCPPVSLLTLTIVLMMKSTTVWCR